MQVDSDQFQRIADLIHSDTSPVGIDAKKTHILIIHMLERLDERLRNLEAQVETLQGRSE